MTLEQFKAAYEEMEAKRLTAQAHREDSREERSRTHLAFAAAQDRFLEQAMRLAASLGEA